MLLFYTNYEWLTRRFVRNLLKLIHTWLNHSTIFIALHINFSTIKTSKINYKWIWQIAEMNYALARGNWLNQSMNGKLLDRRKAASNWRNPFTKVCVFVCFLLFCSLLAWHYSNSIRLAIKYILQKDILLCWFIFLFCCFTVIVWPCRNCLCHYGHGLRNHRSFALV